MDGWENKKMTTNNIPEAILGLLKDKSEATRIAVIGASNDPEKYGNIIVKNLAAKGYKILPVNPKEDEIAGLQAFKNPALLPDPVGLLNFVTPPKVTKAIVEQLDPKRFKALWFQDGSFDEQIIELAQEKFELVAHHACIMVVANYN
jgi:uncharacterized protein